MAHPYHHAVSSANKYGGEPGEYLDLHEWLDGSKQYMCERRLKSAARGGRKVQRWGWVESTLG